VTRPRLLDLGCGPGGASAGYALAGFDVTGVDIEPQPSYPFRFMLADMLTVPLSGFDVIHASPPCQAYARVTAWRGDRSAHPDLLGPVAARLAAAGVPWVIENVPEARPTWDLILCGTQFGLNIRRHRGFWLGGWEWFDLLPPCWHRPGLLPFMHKGERAYADAMGCAWMTKTEARQAIPPAYTEYIGGALRLAVA
jgi:DNA (cytosine-5)-methyltransferase 1